MSSQTYGNHGLDDDFYDPVRFDQIIEKKERIIKRENKSLKNENSVKKQPDLFKEKLEVGEKTPFNKTEMSLLNNPTKKNARRVYQVTMAKNKRALKAGRLLQEVAMEEMVKYSPHKKTKRKDVAKIDQYRFIFFHTTVCPVCKQLKRDLLPQLSSISKVTAIQIDDSNRLERLSPVRNEYAKKNDLDFIINKMGNAVPVLLAINKITGKVKSFKGRITLNDLWFQL
jgi:hypothetical protein